MSIFNWAKPISDAIDVVDQFVEDKDKKTELKYALEQLKEQTYQMELQTKTIPWVDAVHKMGRQLMSWASMLIPAILLYHQPDIDPMALMAIAGPTGVYNFVKGKGK